ncbi:hypothetical protein CRENBAI_022218, partial [Crenichthys baileyi]
PTNQPPHRATHRLAVRCAGDHLCLLQPQQVSQFSPVMYKPSPQFRVMSKRYGLQSWLT